MNKKKNATLLLGAEGVSETEGEDWIRDATVDEIEGLKTAIADASRTMNTTNDTYKSALIDGTGRPYFAMTVLASAPPSVLTLAHDTLRTVRLTD
jgi:hypothetical protein